MSWIVRDGIFFLVLLGILCVSICSAGQDLTGSVNPPKISSGAVHTTSLERAVITQNIIPSPTIPSVVKAGPDTIISRVYQPVTVAATPTGTVTPVPSQIPRDNSTNNSYAPDRVLVKYRAGNLSSSGMVQSVSASLNAQMGASVLSDQTTLGVSGLQVVKLSGSLPVTQAISQYEQNPNVEYAEPDYIVHAIEPVVSNSSSSFLAGSPVGSPVSVSASSITPNDPLFSRQYGLHNTGQVFFGSTYGTADADIDAPEAWSYTTGSSSIIVAVVDTGVQISHPDLAANCLAGYNFITDTAGQTDDNGHGTHCAGIIGAVGNNGVGISGVNWNVKILPCKFLDSNGDGYTSDAIEAINYAKNQGASIISNSWGGGTASSSLKTAIENSGAVVICAAGNNARNTDLVPQYPSAYDSSNIISVASTDCNDGLSSFSNYGATTVDVGAPGDIIYSTYPTSTYAYLSGTSMATPQVSGIAALLKATNPSLTVAQIKAAILNTVDVKSSLSTKCVTGGRVNAYNAVQSVTPLVAKFYGVPGVEVNPLTIQFYDASTGNPTSWSWVFSDGGSATTQNTSHVYNTAGTYTVQLTVTNGVSSSSSQSTMQSG